MNLKRRIELLEARQPEPYDHMSIADMERELIAITEELENGGVPQPEGWRDLIRTAAGLQQLIRDWSAKAEGKPAWQH